MEIYAVNDDSMGNTDEAKSVGKHMCGMVK
jgi:hypothetical protein